jgi:hypothetical protein
VFISPSVRLLGSFGVGDLVEHWPPLYTPPAWAANSILRLAQTEP